MIVVFELGGSCWLSNLLCVNFSGTTCFIVAIGYIVVTQINLGESRGD